jgi:hypothetical protein
MASYRGMSSNSHVFEPADREPSESPPRFASMRQKASDGSGRWQRRESLRCTRDTVSISNRFWQDQRNF